MTGCVWNYCPGDTGRKHDRSDTNVAGDLSTRERAGARTGLARASRADRRSGWDGDAGRARDCSVVRAPSTVRLSARCPYAPPMTSLWQPSVPVSRSVPGRRRRWTGGGRASFATTTCSSIGRRSCSTWCRSKAARRGGTRWRSCSTLPSSPLLRDHVAAYLRPRRRPVPLPVLMQAWEYRHPVGVVGIIAPWNYPLNMAVWMRFPRSWRGTRSCSSPRS